MSNIIYINPDDIELKNAIQLVEQKKELYQKADKAWWGNTHEEPLNGYLYRRRNDAMQNYESALINLALIMMERI